MEYSAVGIPLTILVTAGITNGFNLIDGVNGLASLTAIVAALALSQIAEISGYSTMVHLPMFLAAGVFGFFLINYPFGLIFLGDAGAYTIGFVLSWFGIAVLVNAPDVSPWAILLTFFWPAADTSLAIYRRLRRSSDISAPDRLHVHQMMMRGLEICVLGQNRRQISNPLTTLVLAPFVIAPPIVGVLLWNQNWNAFLAVLFFGSLLFVAYVAAPGLIRRFRR
jgi:UDP-N-acetylmuramyl pentapeptide phosphotransferase/UDP-N-acetylglucosamine-1-phosphate transferase